MNIDEKRPDIGNTQSEIAKFAAYLDMLQNHSR